MFWHLYKYRLKILFTEKVTLFWTGIFPIVLGTFFFLTFSDITEKSENISTINVGIAVENDSEKTSEEIVKADEAYGTFIDSMVQEGYFSVLYETYEDAKKIYFSCPTAYKWHVEGLHLS